MSGKDSVSGTHPDTIAIISATRVFWSCSCCTMYMHDLLPQIACTSIKIGGGGGGGPLVVVVVVVVMMMMMMMMMMIIR